MVIFFNVEKARKHLLWEGFVYTLRRRRSGEFDRARVGSYKNFTDLGKVKIRRMVKAGEVLCSTCAVEAIIRSYILEKRNGC
jgi:hypothetical protein